MVAVENRYQFTVNLRQGMVEVTGLGMAVIGTGDVIDAHFNGKRLEAWAVAVIEQMDAQFVFRPVNAQRGVHRATGD